MRKYDLTFEDFESIYKYQTSGVDPLITTKDFEILQYVYKWHPCEFDKENLIDLYINYGMCIIYDLMARSQMNCEHQHNIEIARNEIELCTNRLESMMSKDLKSKEVLQEWLQN